jgi:hypothetical protein
MEFKYLNFNSGVIIGKMYTAGLYTPKITTFPCYRKSYDSMTDLIKERLKEHILDGSTIILDINHADGDAAGSIVQFALMLDNINKRDYFINIFNGTHHLTFAASILPQSLIAGELEKGRSVAYITTDNTPWVPFFNQTKNFYKKLPDDEKKKLELIIMDHHAWMESDKINSIAAFQEGDAKETPQTTYINAGWEKDVIETWWKTPSIRCASEIAFDVNRKLMEDLYPEKVDLFLKQAVIPLLVGTNTDMRTKDAIENYMSVDRKIYDAIKNVSTPKLIEKYRGEITAMDKFINIANGAIRVSGGLIDRPNYEIMEEEQIYNYPTHNIMNDVVRSLYFAANHKNPLALVMDPSQIGLPNNSPINNILSLDKVHEKVKSGIRSSFLRWEYKGYALRDDACIKFDDTNALICMIYGNNRTISYGRYKERKTVDVAKLLKVAPYMQFFLTGYYPISSSSAVTSSTFIVTAVEGSPYEPLSYAHLSLRAPRGYSVPLGLVAESISRWLKKEYKLNTEDVQGGGHEQAAASRIRQKVLDNVRKDNGLDKFEVINWIIKESVSKTLA